MTTGHRNDPASPLQELAARAGIQVEWEDARRQPRRVSDDTLRSVLGALELPAGSPGQVRDSLDRLRRARAAPGLVVIDARAAFDLPRARASFFQLEDERGRRYTGTAADLGNGNARLPGIERPGYYQLSMGEAQYRLAVAPRHAAPPALADARAGRAWGVAAQIYSLRRARAGGDPALGMGFGDFAALADLARSSGRQGASALAISPVHAMFSADPERYSPYAPSSRLFLNALYGDPGVLLGPAAVGDALRARGLGERAMQLDALDLIDWPHAARLRLEMLREIHAGFRRGAGDTQRDAFRRYREARGEALESHARFEALHAERLAHAGAQGADWRAWPAGLRDPDGPEVLAHAREHADDVTFHAFLQWIAAGSLGAAQDAARQSGMRVGLIADLAVGTDPAGSHAWSRQRDIVQGLSPGAPPDIYNPQGQTWNLTAFSPQRLQRDGYRAFIEMLRAVLAQAGGIRIDHALGLARMWLVPEGAPPGAGAYLRYPLDDLLRLVALEAWRAGAIVVGENLGTVPPGFDERIARAGMLGMKVLWFERAGHDGSEQAAPFLDSRQWDAHAMATTTTHDLPTVAGWWRARDLEWRTRLDLLGPGETGAALRAQRQADRAALWRALGAAGCAAPGQALPAEDDPPLEAVLSFVARSPCPLALAPLEDLLGLAEQPNLPGTTTAHPNWRRRLSIDAEGFYATPDTSRRAAALARDRIPA